MQSGNGDPSGLSGQEEDRYLDLTNGDLYIYQTGAWSLETDKIIFGTGINGVINSGVASADIEEGLVKTIVNP